MCFLETAELEGPGRRRKPPNVGGDFTDFLKILREALETGWDISSLSDTPKGGSEIVIFRGLCSLSEGRGKRCSSWEGLEVRDLATGGVGSVQRFLNRSKRMGLVIEHSDFEEFHRNRSPKVRPVSVQLLN